MAPFPNFAASTFQRPAITSLKTVEKCPLSRTYQTKQRLLGHLYFNLLLLVRRIGYTPSVPNVFIVKLAMATLIRKVEWFRPVFECDPWYIALVMSLQEMLRKALGCESSSSKAGINLRSFIAGIAKERNVRDLTQTSGVMIPKRLSSGLVSDNFIYGGADQPYSVVADTKRNTRSNRDSYHKLPCAPFYTMSIESRILLHEMTLTRPTAIRIKLGVTDLIVPRKARHSRKRQLRSLSKTS